MDKSGLGEKLDNAILNEAAKQMKEVQELALALEKSKDAQVNFAMDGWKVAVESSKKIIKYQFIFIVTQLIAIFILAMMLAFGSGNEFIVEWGDMEDSEVQMQDVQQINPPPSNE